MTITKITRDRNSALKVREARREMAGHAQAYPHRLVLLGPPGVGKGTQAELLSERLGARHVSTGDIFRTAKTLKDRELTPSLIKALEYMQRGDLVPDEIVLGLLVERGHRLRSGGGFILDGFPRTIAQAQAL